MYERVVVAMVIYGAETLAMRMDEKRKLDVFEIKCLQSDQDGLMEKLQTQVQGWCERKD